MREEEGKQLTSFNSNWRRLRLHIADFFPMFSTDLQQLTPVLEPIIAVMYCCVDPPERQVTF